MKLSYKLLFCLLYISISIPVFSNITGKVIDANDGIPLANAAIQCYDKDSLLLRGSVTNLLGEFCIDKDLTKINFVKVSYPGYNTAIINTDTICDYLTIKLYLSKVILSSVTVTGDSRSQNATTETFYLSDSIRSSFTNAAMMIGSLPGFKVDWISGNISIGDNDNVPIIVNGRDMGISYAKDINPKRIKTIQIQRFPPGQYSDKPILINIELFENFIGWDVSGTITGMASLRNNHSNSESPSVDATLSTKEWNTYMSASYKHSQRYEASSFIRKISDTYIEESKPIDLNKPNISNNINQYLLSIGTDNKLGHNHMVSLQTWLDHADSDDNAHYNMSDVGYTINVDDYKYINSITGLYYRGKFTNNLKTISSLIYNYYDIDEHRSYADDIQTSISNISGKKDYLLFSTDVTYSFSKKWEATMGYNYTWRRYTNNVKSSDNVFKSKEKRNKLDATFSFMPSDRFNIRFGGSMLNINNWQDKIAATHTSWIPRLQAYWKPTSWAKINGVYLNEIKYPNLDQLSTSSWDISTNIFQMGNSSLRSMIMHYANIRLTLANYLTLQYMWKKSNNDIVEWYELTNTDKVKKTFINCDYLHQYIGLSFDKSLYNRININFVGNYQWYKRWANDMINHGRTWYGDITATWTSANTNLTILCEYFIRHDMEPLPQGIRYNEQEMLTLGFNYNLYRGRISLSSLFSIPVNLIDKQTYTKINIPGFKSETFNDNRINNCLAKISIRYNLGKGKAKKESNSYITDIEK